MCGENETLTFLLAYTLHKLWKWNRWGSKECSRCAVSKQPSPKCANHCKNLFLLEKFWWFWFSPSWVHWISAAHGWEPHFWDPTKLLQLTLRHQGLKQSYPDMQKWRPWKKEIERGHSVSNPILTFEKGTNISQTKQIVGQSAKTDVANHYPKKLTCFFSSDHFTDPRQDQKNGVSSW